MISSMAVPICNHLHARQAFLKKKGKEAQIGGGEKRERETRPPIKIYSYVTARWRQKLLKF